MHGHEDDPDLRGAKRKIALISVFEELRWTHALELTRLGEEGVPMPVVRLGGWLSRWWRRSRPVPPALADALHELALERRRYELKFNYLMVIACGYYVGELREEELQWAIDAGLVGSARWRAVRTRRMTRTWRDDQDARTSPRRGM
jgi:hypothetical protein